MSKHTDYFPDITIHQCLDCLQQDLEMLQDESWIPDEHSCQASLDMVESVRAKLEKIENG